MSFVTIVNISTVSLTQIVACILAQLIKGVLSFPGGSFRKREPRKFEHRVHSIRRCTMISFLFSLLLLLYASNAPLLGETGSTSLQAKCANVDELECIVRACQGPSDVVVITNGGDGQIVEKNFQELAKQIFRSDGSTAITVHEETVRRGQFFGLLDAVRSMRASGKEFDSARVSVGLMIPGKGTRLSPITQRLFGIKPFMEMLIRCRLPNSREGKKICGPWLSGAAASLYSWTLVAYHLERMGFRGIAWKWGDEPQVSANKLSNLTLDLSEADAVRFASELVVDDDLAKNKEWFVRDPKTGSMMQIHRRERSELLDVLGSFGYDMSGTQPKALGHIGSPAFSYLFLEEAEKIFGSYTTSWMDVDGYLFETLTQPKDLWELDLARDRKKSEAETRKALEKDAHAQPVYVGLAEVVHMFPSFYEDVQKLKAAIETRRGRSFAFEVIDFGDTLYWGDIGQLQKARRAMHEIQEPTPEGDMARRLAAIEEVLPDRFGNRIVGDSHVPMDGTVRNSVLIDTTIVGAADIDGSVLVNSRLGQVKMSEGSVVFGSTVRSLSMGKDSFSYMSIAHDLDIPDAFVHTSIPKDPERIELGLEDWWAPLEVSYNPGKGANYTTPQHFYVKGRPLSNPDSFEHKFQQMRQRNISPHDVEVKIDSVFRERVLGKEGEQP